MLTDSLRYINVTGTSVNKAHNLDQMLIIFYYMI